MPPKPPYFTHVAHIDGTTYKYYIPNIAKPASQDVVDVQVALCSTTNWRQLLPRHPFATTPRLDPEDVAGDFEHRLNGVCWALPLVEEAGTTTLRTFVVGVERWVEDALPPQAQAQGNQAAAQAQANHAAAQAQSQANQSAAQAQSQSQSMTAVVANGIGGDGAPAKDVAAAEPPLATAGREEVVEKSAAEPGGEGTAEPARVQDEMAEEEQENEGGEVVEPPRVEDGVDEDEAEEVEGVEKGTAEPPRGKGEAAEAEESGDTVMTVAAKPAPTEDEDAGREVDDGAQEAGESGDASETTQEVDKDALLGAQDEAAATTTTTTQPVIAAGNHTVIDLDAAVPRPLFGGPAGLVAFPAPPPPPQATPQVAAATVTPTTNPATQTAPSPHPIPATVAALNAPPPPFDAVALAPMTLDSASNTVITPTLANSDAGFNNDLDDYANLDDDAAMHAAETTSASGAQAALAATHDDVASTAQAQPVQPALNAASSSRAQHPPPPPPPQAQHHHPPPHAATTSPPQAQPRAPLQQSQRGPRPASVGQEILEALIREAYELMTAEAIAEAKAEYKTPVPRDKDGLYVRDRESPAYKMAHAHYTLSFMPVKYRIGQRARIFKGKSSLDLHPLARAQKAKEAAHHLLSFTACLSTLYVETIAEFVEIKRVRPDLRAENCTDMIGCYGKFIGWTDADMREWVIRYIGEAQRQSIALRSKQHQGNHDAMDKALATGLLAMTTKTTKGQQLVYGPSHYERVALLLLGINTTNIAKAAALLIRTWPVPKSGLKLEKLGAHRCPNQALRNEYIVRQHIALWEHRMCSFFDSVVGRYDGMHLTDGGMPKRPANWLPGNAQEPHVGFSNLDGSLAWFYTQEGKVPKMSKTQHDEQLQRGFDHADETCSIMATPPAMKRACEDLRKGGSKKKAKKPRLALVTSTGSPAPAGSPATSASSFSSDDQDSDDLCLHDEDDDETSESSSDESDGDDDDDLRWSDFDDDGDWGTAARKAAADAKKKKGLPVNIVHNQGVHEIVYEDEPAQERKSSVMSYGTTDVETTTSMRAQGATGKVRLRSWVKETTFPARLRRKYWHQVIDDEVGLPCTVYARGKRIKVEIDGDGGKKQVILDAEVTCEGLRNGAARFALVRINEGTFACQPAAASPEASAIINGFRIVVVQGGQSVNAYEPAAMVVDEEWEMGLALFGEWASVQDKLPIVFSELDARERSEEAIEVNRRAVRMRDGGMRVRLLKLSMTSDDVVMVVPAPRQLIKAWGTWGKPIPTIMDCTLPDDEVYVALRGLTVPERGEMIIKVNGSKRGRFAVLEYALKRRGDFSKVRTWNEVIPDRVMPKWTCDLLLNMVLSGWGEWWHNLKGNPEGRRRGSA